MRLRLVCPFVCLVLCLLVAACAAPIGPRIVASNALKVTVDWSRAASMMDALVTADEYCQHYGRIARAESQQSEFEMVYECVPP